MKKPNWNIAASFKTRSFRVGGYSVAATVIVIAIAIVVNLLSGALPTKWPQFDLSANQLYSISEQTELLVGSLEQEVSIYWIVQSGSEDSTVEAMLNNYADLSDCIHVEKKDPNVYPTFVQQYTSDSVSNNSLVVVCGERYRYVDYYDIYTYDYSSYYYDGTYDVSYTGEGALTSAIDYVISEDLPKIYTLTGHGESTLAATFSDAIEQENIDTAQLSLLSLEAVPEDADCVLIYAPQSDIASEELEMLRAYLQSGGKLMLITDPLQDGSTLTNLEALMADYGVSANQGIVIEGSQNYYAFGYPYNLLPDYGSHDITSPLSTGGYYVLLSVAQGLTVSDTLPEGIEVTELLTTSEDAYSKPAGYDLTTYDKEEGDIDGPFALAVAIEDSNTGSNIVWISSGGLLDESANTQVSGGNLDLFLNSLSWMVETEDSGISIHAKSLSMEYLTIDSAAASSLTVLFVGIIPVAYLAVGIFIFVRRKRK